MFLVRMIRGCVFAVLAWASFGAQAFMPAGGTWIINAESTGSPGRGFQVEIENEVFVFSYYGYRQDGTSVFYTAVGPIKSNVFTAPLREYRAGTALGAAYKAATEIGSPGNVSITFTSALKGSITLPGESPKAISKFSFGYPANPDGLLGSYVFSYGTSTARFGGFYTLSLKLSPTSSGNGVVANAARTFGCEHMTSGVLVGLTICVESTGSQLDDIYLFKISADRGTGVGTWQSATAEYPLHVLRTATKTGQTTGLNEGYYESVEKLKHYDDQLEGAVVARSQDLLKSEAPTAPSLSLLTAEERNAMLDWATQAIPTFKNAR